MCGIATAVSPATNIVPALLGGLRKREYTGYGSAGIAVLNGTDAANLLVGVRSVRILACNTSYQSGVTARHWLESLAGIPCTVEIASEYRYRSSVPDPDQLVIAISQSGETADTLAALRHAKDLGHTRTLAICNVPESAIVRECVLRLITRAGPEIGVASTKAFTTQLAELFLLTLVVGKLRGRNDQQAEHDHLARLRNLPVAVARVLELEPSIQAWAQDIAHRLHALVPETQSYRIHHQGDALRPAPRLLKNRASPLGDQPRTHQCYRVAVHLPTGGADQARTVTRRAIKVSRAIPHAKAIHGDRATRQRKRFATTRGPDQTPKIDAAM